MIRHLYLTAIPIVLISLFVFFPSFNLALFGDDWLALVRYLYHLGPNPGVDGNWNHLTYFLTPYGAQDILMGLLQNVYGYNSTLYYLTSYVLRLGAAFSLIPLTLYLTKSKLATFFAVLFFSVTTTGLETTNWVFNMPSYITIALFNLFLYFFLKARQDKRFQILLISVIFYYLAYVTTPIRMHGSLPFILLLELFWIFQERKIMILKKAVFRVGIILLVFLIIRVTGHSLGPPNEPAERFVLGITSFITLFNQGRFDFIFHPIIMFGSILIPDFMGPKGEVSAIRQLIPLFTFTFFIFCGIVAFVIYKITVRILFTLTLWTIMVILIFKGNSAFFGSLNQIFSLLIGGYTLILIGFLIIKNFKDKYFSQSLFLSTIWSILSFFFAWWWMPLNVIPSAHRYMTTSAVGVAILLATIISLGKSHKRRLALFWLFLPIIILHIISSKIYLNHVLLTHSQEISNKIWSSFPYISEIGQGSELRLFYFDAPPDPISQSILHDVITFGFPTHIGLLYKYYIHYSPSNNVASNSMEEVISAVTDGVYLTAHGRPPGKPIDVEYIYAFKVLEDGTLIDITEEKRQELRKIISKLNQ